MCQFLVVNEYDAYLSFRCVKLNKDEEVDKGRGKGIQGWKRGWRGRGAGVEGAGRGERGRGVWKDWAGNGFFARKFRENGS